MFKLWTNAGNKHASSEPPRQCTHEGVGALICGMITGSEGNAWMMLWNVPMKLIVLVSPIDAASKSLCGALAPTTPNMNLGAEHIGMRRN
eukprot:9009594-Karenia_brevis.AAC.1